MNSKNFGIFFFLIGHCSPPHQSRLIQFVFGNNLIEFSTNKYASNVVETCISLATAAQQQNAMQTICDLDPMCLNRFCIDASANYVVQKLMESASPEQIDSLFMKMQPYFDMMERYVCGRKIIDKLKSNRNYRMNNNCLSLALALKGLRLGGNFDDGLH